MRSRVVLLLGLCGLGLAPVSRARITIDLDYSLDSNNFFGASGSAARAAMIAAARVYEDRMLDTLAAITPPSPGSWAANFTNPGTGNPQTVQDLNIAPNVIKVYVGGRPLGTDLGKGGPGGYGVAVTTTTQAFQDAVKDRGQAGAKDAIPTDFGTWGGAITFNSSASANWNFSLTGPVAGKNDFLTVALHELGHMMGFGYVSNSKATSWESRTTFTGQYVGPFTGPKSAALYGSNVPLETPAAGANAAHFNYGVMSTLDGTTVQETVFDPDITTGTRKKMTLLDWAALDDLGWDLARPGDANADGKVGFPDLVAVAQNYDKLDGLQRWFDGDFTADGKVNFADLVIVAQNYDSMGPMPGSDVGGDFATDWASALAVSVPEPGVLAMVILPALGALARRRRGIGRTSRT